jgi:hypothetical protein
MQIVVSVTFTQGGVTELAAVDVDASRLFWGSFKKHGRLIAGGKKLRFADPLHRDETSFEEGFISHVELSSTLEALTEGATALYAYSEAECDFLTDLSGRTFISLEKELNCPPPEKCTFLAFSCLNPCHKLRSSTCALRDATSLAQWFQYNRLKAEVDPCSDDCSPTPLPSSS